MAEQEHCCSKKVCSITGVLPICTRELMDSNQPLESVEASENYGAANCAPTEQVDSILKACASYPDKVNAVRLRALVLLLRYGGLRIRDAVTLPRNRVRGDKLFLFTAKTGTPVYCPLPPVVMNAPNAIPDSTYYFWTGASKPKSAVGDWQRSLKRLFTLAGVPDAHAHRFRDTFSVELLLAGVPIERVSILLGHQSVRITEKHYAPWVRARQEQLEADVRRTWPEDKPREEVQTGYTGEPNKIIPLDSVRKNGGGGGSRTPVRKALRHGAYMLISVQFGSPVALRTSKKRIRLVRWFSPKPSGPKGSWPAHCLTPLTGPMSKARGSVRLIN